LFAVYSYAMSQTKTTYFRLYINGHILITLNHIPSEFEIYRTAMNNQNCPESPEMFVVLNVLMHNTIKND